MHQNGLIWKFTGIPMNWQQLDDNNVSVDIIADENDLYQLHNSGRIWKFTGVPMTGWQILDDTLWRRDYGYCFRRNRTCLDARLP